MELNGNLLARSFSTTVLSWRFGLLMLPAVLLIGLGISTY